MKKVYSIPQVSMTYVGEEDMITTSGLVLFKDGTGEDAVAKAGRGDIVTW